MSISLSSRGEEALFGGDIMHSPIQVHAPDLASIFCADRDQARRSRVCMLAYCAERNATYFSSHFTETSAGRILRAGDGYQWVFAE
ncbi:hypothetical protein [Bradyrhizobium sp. ARR65]|uniref:hypothetical protein n=1 Tax=Bradyrhizobium sp. ARR65 TaxID=1040989 RepID=UPI0004679EEA|nr:hypothetical protein [Bradyrhizobium sp. ARR65]